jgi:hypothetical protein
VWKFSAWSCFVHPHGIWPLGWVHVHLAHLRVVKPVDDEIIDGVVALAISLRNRHQLVLRAITLLALDIPISRFWQHGRVACQRAVAGIDLVVRLACDDEERHPLAHF